MALIYASAINKRVNNMPVKSKRSSVETTSSSSIIHQHLQKHSEQVLPTSSPYHHCKQRSNEETHRVDNRARGQSTDNYDPPTPLAPKRCISHCSCSVCGRDLAALSSTTNSGSGGSISNLGSGGKCACSDAELHIVPTAKRTSSSRSHKNLHRSKTSCSDVKRKYTVSGASLSSGGGSSINVDPNNSSQPSSSHQKNVRKISTPVMMMQSMYSDSTSPSKHHSGQMRKNLAKKRLNQKYGMADGADLSTSVYADLHSGGDAEEEEGAEPNKDEALAKCLRVHRSYYRRRSISLDAAVNGMSENGCWRSLESSPDSSIDSTGRRRSSNRAKQSDCGALPPAPRRAVSLVPSLTSDQDSLHRCSSNNSTTSSSSDDEWVGEDYSLIDLSNQNLGFLPDFISEKKECIEHLILDGNLLTERSLEELPHLARLKSLSLNSNKVKNIGLLLQFLSRQCPNLSFLSLIGNPGWPHPVINADLRLYQSYALAAAKFLPRLRFLDTASVASRQDGERMQHCHII